MYYVVEMEHHILLEPKFFGPSMQKRLRKQLEDDVEGTCDVNHGFIVAIHGQPAFQIGRIFPGRPEVTFPVTYQALVFKPYKNEVVLGFVTKVNKLGFFAQVGPLKVYVSAYEIPEDLEYDQEQGTFRSERGETIDKETELRIMITGVSPIPDDFLAVGTIKRPFLFTSIAASGQ